MSWRRRSVRVSSLLDGRMGEWVHTALELALPYLCESCGWRIDRRFVLCSTCAARLRREGTTSRSRVEGLLIVAPFRYEGEVATRIMRRFKYGGVRRLAPTLANEMARAWEGSMLPSRAVTLVPVPASGDRLRLRGFNQAAVLAEALGEAMGVPVAGLARRVRSTRSQTTLAPAARARNMAGAFGAGAASPHRPLVLVDDVTTTGATLEALARTLRARGHEVPGAVVAFRTPAERRAEHKRIPGDRRPSHVS